MAGKAPRRPAFWWFVAAVTLAGALALTSAVLAVPSALAGPWIPIGVLALLTVLTGEFKVKVPGQSATVSVSEFFVFTSLLLFGPAPATLTVALDGLWSSIAQKNRRWYRTLFNVAEPAFGTWAAGVVYAVMRGPDPTTGGLGLRPLLAVFAMTLTYFASNSVLTSLAVGLESRVSPYRLWKRHSLYLGLNYYAAAALAMLVAESSMRLAVLGLVVPLLVLSYVAYRAVSTSIEVSQQYTREVEQLYQSTIETLAVAVDAKDQVTHGHVRRVQRHTVALARVLGVGDPLEIKAIQAAALLHDVGKLAVPDYVLNKPGVLTRSEFEKMKLHVNAGAAILESVHFPFPVVPIVLGHHEQWSGRGYPRGLAGEEIPIGARILTVVDCFDAVTSDRPYRRKMTDEEGIAILRARSGTMYDPRVVEAFVALVPTLRQEDGALDREEPHVEAMALLTNASVGDGRSVSDEDVVSLAEVRKVAPAAFERIRRRLPDAEACLLFKGAGSDTLAVAEATPRIRPAFAGARLQLGEGLSGWVAAHRSRAVNSSPDLELGDAAAALGLQSCVSVPLFAVGDLVGVLSVYLPQPRGFSDADVRAVGMIAHEVGLELARRSQDTDDARECVA